jgi:hypothetical protein
MNRASSFDSRKVQAPGLGSRFRVERHRVGLRSRARDPRSASTYLTIPMSSPAGSFRESMSTWSHLT